MNIKVSSVWSLAGERKKNKKKTEKGEIGFYIVKTLQSFLPQGFLSLLYWAHGKPHKDSIVLSIFSCFQRFVYCPRLWVKDGQ